MKKKKKAKRITILIGYSPIFPSAPLFEKFGEEYKTIVQLHHLMPEELKSNYGIRQKIKITIEAL